MNLFLAALDPFTVSLIVGALLAVATFLIGEALKKPPQVENRKPSDLGDFSFPTATEGRPVPIIWGTVKLEGPNVVWWGDVQQRADRKTLKNGLFAKKRFTRGFFFNFGMQMALCRGPVDEFRQVWIGDKLLATLGVADDGLTILDPNFFGGNSFGNGGIQGVLRVHSGKSTQTANTYLNAFQSPNVPLRGTAYAVWEGGYHGNSDQIEPWKFEVSRFPNGLGLTGGKEKVNTFDANPAAVIYEILTDTDWGFGLDVSKIDVTNLTTVADTLFTEGNGFSLTIDNTRQVREIINEVERQINGTLALDRQTGKYKIILVRDGFDVDTIPQIDSTNIIRIKDFTRTTWSETTNQFRLEYTDRAKGYFKTYAQADDLANQRIQKGERLIVTERFPGVKNRTLATKLATRQLKVQSLPLLKANVVVDRTFWNRQAGEVVALTDANAGLTKQPMLISRIDFGSLENGEINVALVEHIYEEVTTPAYGEPDDTNWTNPTQDVDPPTSTEIQVFEAPKAFVDRDDDQPGVADRIWATQRRFSGPEIAFGIHQRNDPATPSGAYSLSGEADEFMKMGNLRTALTVEGANPGTVDVDPDEDTVADLFAAISTTTTESLGLNLTHLLKIEDEFLLVTSATDNTTHMTCNTVYRGVMDTVPADHDTGVDVYLLNSTTTGGGLTDDIIPQTNVVDVQLRTESMTDSLTEGETTVTQITMNNRTLRPYPPTQLKLNTVLYDDPVDFDTQKPSTSGLDNRGINLEYIRRDFRTTNEVDSITTDAATIDSSFPTANTTRYRVEVLDVPTTLTNGLQAYWKLDESSGNALDASGGGHTGTDNNTVGTGSSVNTPTMGTARDFVKANSEFFEVSDHADFQFSGNVPMTVCAWVNLDDLDDHMGYITKWKGTATIEREWALTFNTTTNKHRFVVSNDGSASTGVEWGTAAPTGTWEFLVGWHDPDADVVALQVNNGTAVTAAHSTGMFSGNQPVFLGKIVNTLGDQPLNGLLDGIGVWNRLLTAAEKTALYNAGNGQQHPFTTGGSLFTTTFNSGEDNIFLSRTKILREKAGVIPTDLEVSIETDHTVDSVVYTATQDLDFGFGIDTSTLDNDTNLGNLDDSVISPTYTAPETGSYGFEIGQALASGIVEARINAGSFTTVISSGTTGTLAGVTSSDTIEVRHTETGGSPTETFLQISPPTATDGAYAILIL